MALNFSEVSRVRDQGRPRLGAGWPGRGFALSLAVMSCAVLLTAGGMGCSPRNEDNGEQKSRNLLDNGGLEEGKKGWFVPESPDWTAFKPSERTAKEGDKSAYLEVRSEGEDHSQIFGLAQDVSPDAFPSTLSGAFRIDAWEKATPLQYIQAIVIVENTDLEGDFVNRQIHYVLGGLEEPPYELENGKFVIVNKGEPETGKWVSFKRDLKEDFKKEWGAVPKEFSSIRVIFEARYEQRAPDAPQAVADAYFDDLSLGS